jgi:D-sedoheptulose 7-phosphate isomerase
MQKKSQEDVLERISDAIAESITVKTKMLDKNLDSIAFTSFKLSDCLRNGGKILLCGNGGSAADSQHIAAELVVRFRSHINRKALAAMSLTTDTSILTACGNDYGFDKIFSRQVKAFGNEGDILIGISTSGNSKNVMLAIEQATKQNMMTIGLLGGDGGKMRALCDHTVVIPSNITARIQECHIMVGHIWCETIEDTLFPKQVKK